MYKMYVMCIVCKYPNCFRSSSIARHSTRDVRPDTMPLIAYFSDHSFGSYLKSCRKLNENSHHRPSDVLKHTPQVVCVYLKHRHPRIVLYSHPPRHTHKNSQPPYTIPIHMWIHIVIQVCSAEPISGTLSHSV